MGAGESERGREVEGRAGEREGGKGEKQKGWLGPCLGIHLHHWSCLQEMLAFAGLAGSGQGGLPPPPRAPCSSALLLFCSLPPEVELSLPPQAYPPLHSPPAARTPFPALPLPWKEVDLDLFFGARRADIISKKPVGTGPEGLSLPLLPRSEALS